MSFESDQKLRDRRPRSERTAPQPQDVVVAQKETVPVFSRSRFRMGAPGPPVEFQPPLGVHFPAPAPARPTDNIEDRPAVLEYYGEPIPGAFLREIDAAEEHARDQVADLVRHRFVRDASRAPRASPPGCRSSATRWRTSSCTSGMVIFSGVCAMLERRELEPVLGPRQAAFLLQPVVQRRRRERRDLPENRQHRRPGRASRPGCARPPRA